MTVTRPDDAHGAPVHRKGDIVTLSFHCDAAVPLHDDTASVRAQAGRDARKAA